jgi:putative ABC transport system permease protein
MTTLWQDVRYGLRMLVKNPGFACVVVVILAVGIGVNTAVFSVVNAVLFRELPYDEPDRIVSVWEQKKQQGMDRIGSSHHNLVYWRQNNKVFECMSGVGNRRVYVTGLDKSYHIKALAVSSCFFSLMGAGPAFGRGFLPEEEQRGNEHVVVLSYGFWRDRMGGDPEILGKDLVLDEKPYRIVGVMPANFRHSLTRDAPFWVPLVLNAEDRGGGTRVVARLKKGVTVEQARAEMSVLEARLAQEDAQATSGTTVAVDSFMNDELGGNRTLLHVLWGAVGLVLLVACTNAAGLFLVHGNIRQKEMAVRAAVGASRGRIMRQMLTEGVIVSLTAGVVGVLLAFWVTKGLVGMCPSDIPRMRETRVDTSVLFFALGLSILTGLLFSLLPAWKAAGVHLSQIMKGTSVGPAAGWCWRHLRKGLVVSQIGMALILLMGVGVLIRSLIHMQREDLGFVPEGVLVTHIELPKVKYPEQPQWTSFFEPLLCQVQALSGVQSAAVVSGGLELSTGGGFVGISVEGRPPADSREKPMARLVQASLDLHKALGMAIVKGRGFTEQDIGDQTTNIIIDETLAQKFFADGDPLGQRINGMTIVGVVKTIRDFEELAPSVNTIYVPSPARCYMISDLVVRTSGDPLKLADAIRAQVALLDKDLEVSRIYTVKENLADMLAPKRFITIVLGLFAQIALILAGVGLYGVIQYSVAQGTRDVGIRMALGATRSSVLLGVLRQGLTVALIGVVAGAAGALAVTRVLSSLLYGVSSTDPLTLLAVSLVLITIALLASYIPARRAARIDPMAALRCE